MQYVLASASPRRRELLKDVVDNFEITVSDFDEDGVLERNSKLLVQALAQGKATSVALRPENENKTVIGSDTIVVHKGEVLGKPKDEEDARRMLSLLSGKKHYVYTGVCFAFAVGGKVQKMQVATVKTAVYFNRLTAEQIQQYIQSGSPMDKAGAYGIQDGGLVKKIKGSYSNVVGLPVEKVKKMRMVWEKRKDD